MPTDNGECFIKGLGRAVFVGILAMFLAACIYWGSYDSR
jgi:hypothetical protein